MNAMKTFRHARETMDNVSVQAKETLTDVSDASKKVIETTNWATVALISVAAVSVLALGVGLIALSRSTK